MADELDTFVDAIMDETGSDTVDIVSHSLGVTGTRYWMDREDRYDDIGTFIGLGGANHGTTMADSCRIFRDSARMASMMTGAYFFGLDFGQVYEQFCKDDFVTTSSATSGQLADLNRPDETPGDVDYYTIRARSDECFPVYADSPELAGAENAVIDGGHFSLLHSKAAKERVTSWLTDE